MTEGTPLLWKEFAWPFCSSHEECSVVKELLKVCRHIKVLSFPNSSNTGSIVLM